MSRLEDEPTITCAGCNKGIWVRDSYSPPGTDEALCAECDTEVSGRKHRPTLPLNEDGLKQLRKECDEVGPAISSQRFGNEPYEHESE